MSSGKERPAGRNTDPGGEPGVSAGDAASAWYQASRVVTGSSARIGASSPALGEPAEELGQRQELAAGRDGWHLLKERRPVRMDRELRPGWLRGPETVPEAAPRPSAACWSGSNRPASRSARVSDTTIRTGSVISMSAAPSGARSPSRSAIRPGSAASTWSTRRRGCGPQLHPPCRTTRTVHRRTTMSLVVGHVTDQGERNCWPQGLHEGVHVPCVVGDEPGRGTTTVLPEPTVHRDRGQDEWARGLATRPSEAPPPRAAMVAEGTFVTVTEAPGAWSRCQGDRAARHSDVLHLRRLSSADLGRPGSSAG